MALAVVDGWFRDFALVPMFGNWTALFVSGVIMVSIFYAGAYLMLKKWGVPEGRGPLILLGLMWSGLTFGFEAIMGLVFRGLSVSEFLILYHPRDLILKGETITIGLALVMFAPLLVGLLFLKAKKVN